MNSHATHVLTSLGLLILGAGVILASGLIADSLGATDLAFAHEQIDQLWHKSLRLLFVAIGGLLASTGCFVMIRALQGTSTATRWSIGRREAKFYVAGLFGIWVLCLACSVWGLLRGRP